jgi:hypothetical protein
VTVARRPPSGRFARVSVAALLGEQVLRDVQAQAGAAGVAVARTLQPVERAEDRIELVGGDAGALVVDEDANVVRVGLDPHPGAHAVAHRVADQVAQRAAQAHRLRLHDGARPVDHHLVAELGVVVGERLHQREHVHALRRLGVAGVAEQLQRRIDQLVHLAQVADALLRCRGVPRLHRLQAQPHAGQRRAQVVRDRRGQQPACAELLVERGRHLVEDLRHAADLDGAPLAVQARWCRMAAERVAQRGRRLGQPLHRRDQPTRAPPGHQADHEQAHAVVEHQQRGRQGRRRGIRAAARVRWRVRAGHAADAGRGRQRGEGGHHGGRAARSARAGRLQPVRHQRPGKHVAGDQRDPHQDEQALEQRVGNEPLQPIHALTCASNR